MPTTPTSMVLRLTGQEAWPDAVTFSAGNTYGALQTIPVQAPTVVIAPATTTLTLTPAAHAGRFVTVAPTGGLAITPAPATGTFNVYVIFVTASVTGGNLTIDAKAGAAADVFSGNATQNKVATGNTVTPTTTNTNLITLNGSTTGGIKGDMIEMIDVATNLWWLFIQGQYTGTFATPFSNH